MSLEKAINLFLQYLNEKNKSLGTIKEYRKNLSMFVRFLLKEVGLEEPILIHGVQGSHLTSYLNYLSDVRKYQPSSRNRQMNVLRSFFKFCKLRGLVEHNQAEQLERLEEEETERIFLTFEEFNSLVDKVEHRLIKLVLITLFYTGARITECLSLEIDDIDFDSGFITIRKGKGNKPRRIPMHDELDRLLRHYINNWRVDTTSNSRLFLTERSGGLSAVYVNRILKETVRNLGWNKKVTCHVLRHSFASALVQNNVNIVAVKELLGHANLKTTSGYAHINQQSAEEAIQTLGQ